jgi:thioredoxin-related protein
MLLVLAFPIKLMAQQSEELQEIIFEKDLSWEQTKAKAKAENKCIFIDVYASWCLPCKKMDRDVYTDVHAGKYFNEKFVSIKLQVDSSKKDDDQIKKRYYDARYIKREYKVLAFPTFLFFSPEGKIIHRDFGFKTAENLIAMGKDAINPAKQFYTLLNSYVMGEKNYSIMPYLANLSNIMGEDSMARIIGADYINNYLCKLPTEKLYVKDNLNFIANFTEKSTEPGFEIFYDHLSRVNSVIQARYAESFIESIITKEEIESRLWNVQKQPYSENPNWRKIQSIISRKYNKQFAKRTILNAQIKWFENKKDWRQVIKYNIKMIETYGLDTMGIGKTLLNNMIYYTIFMHATKKSNINKAIKWMEALLKSRPNDPAFIDTYANLLYKSGRAKLALVWEEKALKLRPSDSDISINYNRMKRGEPTWIGQND